MDVDTYRASYDGEDVTGDTVESLMGCDQVSAFASFADFGICQGD